MNLPMRAPLLRTSLVIGLLLIAQVSFAQIGSPGTDSGGFQPGGASISPLPWEHIDAQTGAVGYAFTDLALPGNAGQALQFVRYGGNPHPGEAWVPPQTTQWMGLAGYVMAVGNGMGFPGVGTVMDSQHPEWLLHGGPTLIFGDGARRQTFYWLQPDTSSETGILSSMRWVITADLLRYDQLEGMLYLPDGRYCHYAPSGNARLLSWCKDAFDHLIVELDRNDAVLTVTQHVGAQTRTVVLTYASAFDLGHASVFQTPLPVTMTYSGRTWQYTQNTPDPNTSTLTVTPPVGAEWVFAYTTTIGGGGLIEKHATITTPGGGVVTYDYTPQFHPANYPCTDQFHGLALTQRSSAGPNVTAGTWTFAYTFPCMLADAPDGRLHPIIGLTVSRPSGLASTYSVGNCGVAADDPENGIYFVGNTQTFCAGPTGSGFPASATYEAKTLRSYGNSNVELKRMFLQQRAIQSCDAWPSTGCRWYTTTFGEDNAQNIVSVQETNQDSALVRTTLYTYLGDGWPFLSALRTSETVVVEGSPCQTDPTPCGQIQHVWSRNATTGFVEQEVAGGVTTAYDKDAYGNVATVTTNGHTTNFTYAWGQVASVVGPAHTVTRTINPDGTVAAETEGYGTIHARTTLYEYDDLGRPTSTQGPGETTPVDTAYTATTVTTTRGTARARTTFDGFGRPIRTETGDDAAYTARTVTQYDAEGTTVFVGLPVAANASSDPGTSIEYDSFGRVTVERHTDNTTRTHTYTRTSESVTDENGHTTVATTQLFGTPTSGLLTSLQDAAGTTWTYGYTVTGSLARVQTLDGVHRDWTYAATTHRLTSEQHPESGTVYYTHYNDGGALLRKVDANGTVFEYGYDDNERVTSITATPANDPVQVTTITYEAGSDRRATTTVSVGGQVESSTAFTYDTAGRLDTRTDTVDGKAFATSFTFDTADNLTTITYPSGRQVAYAYDTQYRLSAVSNAATQATYASGFSYEPSGALTSYTAGNGVVTWLTYHATRQWLETVMVGQGANRTQLTYGYDNVGNISGINDWRDGHSQTFGYDNLDRLTSALGIYGSLTYAYDVHGNRQAANQGAYTYAQGNPFRLQAFSGVSNLDYDANGNLTAGGPAHYKYTPDNLLAESAITGGPTAHYAYDVDAWRVKKVIGSGTPTYYVRGPDGQLLSEWANTSPAAAVKDYLYAGGRLIGVVSTTATPK